VLSSEFRVSSNNAFRALDKTVDQTELLAQAKFLARHRAVVGLVIVSAEVEDAVQDEHLQFLRQRVFEAASVGGGDVAGDHDVAGKVACDFGHRRKGEHVGGLVLAAELPVEGAHAAAGDHQDVDLPTQAGSASRSQHEAAQSRLGNPF
jgi:hypothetical protein